MFWNLNTNRRKGVELVFDRILSINEIRLVSAKTIGSKKGGRGQTLAKYLLFAKNVHSRQHFFTCRNWKKSCCGRTLREVQEGRGGRELKGGFLKVDGGGAAPHLMGLTQPRAVRLPRRPTRFFSVSNLFQTDGKLEILLSLFLSLFPLFL